MAVKCKCAHGKNVSQHLNIFFFPGGDTLTFARQDAVFMFYANGVKVNFIPLRCRASTPPERLAESVGLD